MRLLPLLFITLAAPAFAQQGNMGGHFFDNWDLNADGEVSVEELKERRSDVFASFDSNEDGYVDAEEYTYFDEARANDMENHGGGKGGGKGGKGMMIRAADGMRLEANDLDKDGKVSKEEFLSQVDTWFTTLDRNQDGKVTKDDFGKRVNP